MNGEADRGNVQDIYEWLDEIPLSRPKRNVARDFSDGGLYTLFLNKIIVEFAFKKY